MTNTLSKFGSLFETSRDAIIGVESEKVTYNNPAAKAIFGDLVGLSAGAFLPEEILAAAKDGNKINAEVRGESFTVSSVRDGDALIISLVPTGIAQNKETAIFCANITKQLTDAISSIYYSITRIMEVSTLNNIDFTGPGRNIMRSYFCLKRLARNIKTVENMNYGGIAMNFLTYDMKQLIGDLVDTVEHFFPGKVSFEVQSSSLKPIYADVDDVRICEVILNLIVNSLQHARDAKDANARITVTLKPTRDNIIITVADNCGGMSDHALSRAFSKFSTDGDLTAMAEGAGLGLAVCKGLVEAHGGALVIESHEGKGTLTRISVPVHTKGILRSQKFLLENNDMKFILTELSVILGNEFFDLKYLD